MYNYTVGTLTRQGLTTLTVAQNGEKGEDGE